MLEAVLHGALARGTNAPTLVLLNVCLLGCILVTASLLLPVVDLPAELLPHIVALLIFAVALLVSINWLVAQTGTVSVEEQKKELFGGQAAEGEGAGAAGAAGAAGGESEQHEQRHADAGAAAGAAGPGASPAAKKEL